mmetsp:Transcript_855/g.1654  ORF Transcript_855/g.1654 Transcript_855/m.1654 type:complete len:93 (+) Transcript_855:271-549(+)
MEGWLYKRGLVNTAYKRRYFRLGDGALRYFQDDKGSVQKGMIKLAFHSLEDSREEFGFRLVHSQRSFWLRAENEEGYKKWMDALKKLLPSIV